VSRILLVIALTLVPFAVMASTAGARHRPGSCPGANLRPTRRDLGRIRAATLCLVNRERVDRGERALVASARLQWIAQRHSQSMASGGYFAHVGPRGDTPFSRIRSVGFLSRPRRVHHVGENIGWGTLWMAKPRAIVAAWMASPGHRANILDRRFRFTAIGVCPRAPHSRQRGAIYTQDFGG
jgi:uncharacterized protein YkwD